MAISKARLAKVERSLIERLRTWHGNPVAFVKDELGATPDPGQADALRALAVKPRVAMASSKNTGKAQPADLILDTPSGRRRFGELRVGDCVFGRDGHPTEIRAVFDRGNLPTYRVTFDDGSSTLACGEHLWQVRGARERAHIKTKGWLRSSGKVDLWVLLSTEQIIARGVRNKNGRFAGRQFDIPRYEAVEYPAAILPVDPYVLGVWLGDGVRLSGRYATKPTDEIEDEIRRRGYRTSGSKAGIVLVYDLQPELKRLGIFKCYSHQRYVPSMFLRTSAQQRRDLLCGLMDTDGEIDRNGHMQFSSTSKELVEQVQWLARSLGGVAYEQKPRSPFYYGKDGIRIGGRTAYRLVLNLPFNPFRVPHRRGRWKDPYRNGRSARFISRKIDNIEPAGIMDCRCIQVAAEDGLYLTNDFIVTHNTTTMAWAIWWFLVTRQHPKIAAVSVSGDNLSANLWAELAKWQAKSELLRAWFSMGATKIVAKQIVSGRADVDPARTWFCEARTWAKAANPQEQSTTLAGLHADHLLFVLDEAGAIPNAVMASAEAALAGGGDLKILQGGNTTHLSGPLYRAATSERGLWHLVRMNGDPDDPKRSPRVDQQWARDQIAMHGRDNPWVMINVFGEFPPHSINALIGPDEMHAAEKRSYRAHDIEPFARVIGVDVAREGLDASVMFPRQGPVAFTPTIWRNIDGIYGAAAVSRKWEEWDADAVFVDSTGGFGSAWIDCLSLLGRQPVPVLFSGTPHDNGFYNKRAEMYWDAAAWLKTGQIPVCPELVEGMTQITYTFKRGTDRIVMEDKEQLKLRLGPGAFLDVTDAFVETFAEPVLRKGGAAERLLGRGRRARHRAEYDPYAIQDSERIRG